MRPDAPNRTLSPGTWDLAASIQTVTEEVVLRVGRDLHSRTGMPNLVLAGSGALNCVANGRLFRDGPFDSIWIQPAAGDAVGASLFVWHQLLERPRQVNSLDAQQGSFLGPKFNSDEVKRFLAWVKAAGRRFATVAELIERIVKLLAEEKVVGWFQGRMEFDPRALGARSILRRSALT